MENKNITKFPKGFFQMERPTINAGEALKNEIPFQWENVNKNVNNQKISTKEINNKNK